MATVADRVRETTSTTGTGALTLAGATPGCRTFNAAIGNAVPCFYTLLDANGTGWECGIGQLSSSTSFTRTTIQKSSNANAAINLSAGTHTLMCALTEGWASTFNVDASGNVGMNMTPASTVVLDLKEPDAATDLIVGLSAGTGARAQIRSVAQADGTSSEVAIHTTTGGVTSEKFRFNGAGKLSGPTFALERTADGQLFINASAAAGYVTINTAGAERMRIDSSGNVGIGASSVSGRFQVRSAGVNPGLEVDTSSAGASLLAYDRVASAYKVLNLRCSSLTVSPSDGTKFTIDANGNPIFNMTATPPTLATNSDVTFNLTSNTNLRISARGSDGVTRVANITLA